MLENNIVSYKAQWADSIQKGGQKYFLLIFLFFVVQNSVLYHFGKFHAIFFDKIG
jgi:hypothetical protein